MGNLIAMVLGYVLAGGLLFFLWRTKTKLMLVEQSENMAQEQRRVSEAKLAQREQEAHQLAEKITTLEKSEVQSQTELKVARETLQHMDGKMREAFQSMAATALEGNNRQFMELARTVLQKESQVSQEHLSKRQQAIDELLKPMAKTLEQYQQQAQVMERDRQRSFANIEGELKRVAEAGAKLSQETMALKNALKKPHVRGRWGEVQLRNCIELAGMSEFADVSFQDTQSAEDGRQLRPDMTVRMPGGRVVVVDAKTPIDAFLSALEATTEEQKRIEMERHGKLIRTHVGQLAEKGYAREIKNSADFTVLFLPNESFLYAALETQPDLVDYALQKKILIATPPTLIGLLKVIRFGWNEDKLARNAQEISAVGQQLHKYVADFLDGYETIGKSLDKAREAYGEGVKRLQSRILPKARHLEELGAKGVKELPESLNL